MAEPILSMAAASEAADPDRMRRLLEGGRFPRRARQYLMDNSPLVLGLPDGDKDQVTRARESYADAALAVLVGLRVDLPVVTGKALSDMIDKASVSLQHQSSLGGGRVNEGTATLLREILGLPGDPGVCALLESREVRLNACQALCQLGAELSPWLLTAISDAATAVVPSKEVEAEVEDPGMPEIA